MSFLRRSGLALSITLSSALAYGALALSGGGGCVIEETDGGDEDDDGGGGTATGQPNGGAGGMAAGGAGGNHMGGFVPACDAYVPRSPEPEIIVGPNGLEQQLVGLMDGAQTDLMLMMYQLSTSATIQGLVNAKGRGVDVRVLLDYEQGVNENAIDDLTAAGVAVQAMPSEFTHSHGKVMIVDHQTAVVMSANMNVYSMSSERNYGIVDRDAQDIEDLVAIFERDWAGSGDIDMSCTRLVVSPENARQRLLELIAGAQTSLDLAVMYISDAEVKSAIKSRIQSGVPTRVLLANPEWIDDNPATAQELIAAGAEAKYLYAYELHAKLLVADDIAFVGSENFSYTSLENNREVGVFVTEPGPAAFIKQQFEQDWAAGTQP